jgi:ferric-dicitrate binding protein FerR (iron transport regulator)
MKELKNTLIAEKGGDAAFQEALKRFVDDTYSLEDMALILTAIRNDAHYQDFIDVSDRLWQEIANSTTPQTKEQKEVLLREAALLRAKFAAHSMTVRANTQVRPYEIGGVDRGRWRLIGYAAAVAAVLLCIVVPATYFYRKPAMEQSAVQYIEEATQYGERKTVVLPDGSKVTLNVGSSLKYSDRYATGKERQVELHGEALFDVTSDPARPFMVKTENMNVRVLGTVFNVKAYENDRLSSVTVASGKVEVDLAASGNGNGNGKALLEKNQQINMDKSTGLFEKTAIDADRFLSWTDGVLYFSETPIREVVNMLNRYYPQTEIVLAEGEYTCKISGKFNNQPIDAALTSIVFSTGLKLKKQGSRYVLSIKN